MGFVTRFINEITTKHDLIDFIAVCPFDDEETILYINRTVYISQKLFDGLRLYCGVSLLDEVSSVFGIPVVNKKVQNNYTPSEFKDTTTTTPIWKWD